MGSYLDIRLPKVIRKFFKTNICIVDYTSVEFSIGYDNRIEVESVGLNLDFIREALENNFMDFGELVEEESNDEERDDE